MIKKTILGYAWMMFSFLLMWAFFSGNFFNEDYINYEYSFYLGLDRFEDLNIEPLYAYITYWSSKVLQIKDYLSFKSLMAFVFMIPYWFVLNQWSENRLVSVLVYLPLFLIQVVLLRNFMAFGIIILGIYIMAFPTKNKTILYTSIIMLAMGIHNLMFVYLILIADQLNIRLLNKPIIYFLLCLMIGLIFGGIFYGFISSIETTKYNNMTGTASHRVLLGGILLINYYWLRFIKYTSTESTNEKMRRIEGYILRLNLLFILVLVFFTINFNAIRLCYNLLVFDAILVSNCLVRSIRTHGNVMSILSSILWAFCAATLMINKVLDIQFEELFKYNYFIQSLNL